MARSMSAHSLASIQRLARALVKLGVSCLAISAFPATTSANGFMREVRVSVATALRHHEALSIADIRPQTRGELGGDVAISLPLTEAWWWAASGYFGGGRFDFARPGAAGTITDFSWLVRGGLDWRPERGAQSAFYCGAGYEYGESRSWLHASSANESGPHAYSSAAYLRMGAERHISGALSGYSELTLSAGLSHAQATASDDQYHWLAQSLEASLGVRVAFDRP